MEFTPNPPFIFKNEKIKFIKKEENPSDEQERKIFFELKPRCVLLISVVGAYNGIGVCEVARQGNLRER